MQIIDGIYNDTFALNSYEVDPFYHVQTPYYFRIMQEAAGSHSYHRKVSIPHLQEEQRTWVVTRTVMDIDHYAQWPATLRVETWPQEPWKLYFPRVCRLYDGSGTRLFQSLSHWVVMDTCTGRPVKPQTIADRFGTVEAKTFVEPNLGRRPTFSPTEYTETITYEPSIRYADCDLNQHVNNVAYLEWMLDSLPHTFRDAHLISKVDIAYLAQTYRDDRIIVRTGISDSGLEMTHEVSSLSQDGEKPVCVAVTRWIPRV